MSAKSYEQRKAEAATKIVADLIKTHGNKEIAAIEIKDFGDAMADFGRSDTIQEICEWLKEKDAALVETHCRANRSVTAVYWADEIEKRFSK